MSKEGRQCPECGTTLNLALLSELVGQRKAGGLEATLPAAGAVFDFFDFWVCHECGRTLIYAEPTTARGRRPRAGSRRAGAASSASPEALGPDLPPYARAQSGGWRWRRGC